MDLKQYDIVLVNLDPTVGKEIRKTRPCVIISPNEMNKFLDTIIIAPMTSKSKKYPTRIRTFHNKTEGWVVLDQIRTIDRKRIVAKLGKLNTKEISELKKVVFEMLVE